MKVFFSDMIRALPLPSLVERFLSPRLILERRTKRELITGEPELRLIPLFGRPGTIAVDVGANHGVYTYLCALEFSRVVAFEPNPGLAEILSRAFDPELSATTGEVVVRAEGVSNSPGELTLSVPVHRGREIHTRGSLEQGSGQQEREYKVRVVTLDDAILDPVGFIKIDVEGHECDVLTGAAGLIDRDRPVVLVEAEERHRAEAVAAVFSFFAERDYSGYCLYQGQLMPVGDFDIDVHQRVDFAKPIGGQAKGSYVNNFIFFPSERAAAAKQIVGALKRSQ